MQLLKPCVQSADNQNRNETQSALRDIWYDLLCALAVCFVFFSLLRSVLASFPEWRDMVMLSPAFLVISVCL